MVNSVISSMLLYSFHIYSWPVSLLKEITKSIRNFIWSGNITQSKICMVAWRVMCKPKAEGGFTIKDPRLVNTDALLQLCWKMGTSDEQWAHIC